MSTIIRVHRISVTGAAFALILFVSDATLLAQRSRGNVRSSAGSSVNHGNNANRSNNANRNNNVNRNTNVNNNVNRNTNVNRNIDVDRDIDIDRDVDVDVHGRYGCCYGGSGWGTAAAVATTAIVTAAVVGSVVHTIPPSCSTVIVSGLAYQQCGSTWYEPQIAGSSTTYVVVNAPR